MAIELVVATQGDRVETRFERRLVMSLAHQGQMVATTPIEFWQFGQLMFEAVPGLKTVEQLLGTLPGRLVGAHEVVAIQASPP